MKAVGTLGALIPESDSVEVPRARVYFKTPVIKTRLVDGVPVGERIEKNAFLLEKPGELIIPEQKYFWWNPATGKISTRRLAERKVLIEDNPDLAILKSIQDSLDALSSAGATEEAEQAPVTVFGLLIWQFVLLLGVGLVFLLWMKKFTLAVIKKTSARKAAYLQSEKYYFEKFARACKHNDLNLIQNRLRQWLGKLTAENRRLPVPEWIARYGTAELGEIYFLLEKQLFGRDESGREFPTAKFFDLMRDARRNYLRRTSLPAAAHFLELNS